MSRILLQVALAFSALTPSSLATVDAWSTVTIVAYDFSGDEGLFRLVKVPFVACIGIPTGAIATAFTAPHKLLNAGCGVATYHNENLLSCAKLNVEASDIDMSASRATIDVSPCRKKGAPLDFLSDYPTDPRLAALKQLRQKIYQAMSENFRLHYSKVKIIGAN